MTLYFVERVSGQFLVLLFPLQGLWKKFETIIVRKTKYFQKLETIEAELCLKTWKTQKFESIDAHRLKIQGRGYLMFFAKIPRWGQGFQEKLSGGSPYFRFYCIFINKCFEICLRGVLYLPSPLPPPPPPRVHLCLKGNKVGKIWLFGR